MNSMMNNYKKVEGKKIMKKKKKKKMNRYKKNSVSSDGEREREWEP